MAAASVTKAGHLSDLVLPPRVSLRLRNIAAHWGRYALYAPPKVLADLVPEGRLAVDVGAHRGLWAYSVSRKASVVHAFEPNPDVYAYLSRIHLRSVRTHDVALSDSEGWAVLSMPETGATGRSTIATTLTREVATVPTKLLDSYEFADVGFIKIDVEGHEEAVLRGAIKTLEAWHPTLLIEAEERHNLGGLDRIRQQLASLGYTHTAFLLEGKLIDFASYNPAIHQVGDPNSPTYVNNFVFATSPIL